MCLRDGWKTSMAQAIVYIRERLPYWLSCDVRAHKFHVGIWFSKIIVFQITELEVLCGITTERSRSVTV